MKITRFDRNACRYVQAEVEKTLNSVSGDLGVTFSFGRGSFDGSNFIMKLTATVEGGLSPEAQDFRRYATQYGLCADDLGQGFGFDGEWYEVIGLSVKSPKRPILARNTKTDRVYKFGESTVKRLIHGPG